MQGGVWGGGEGGWMKLYVNLTEISMIVLVQNLWRAIAARLFSISRSVSMDVYRIKRHEFYFGRFIILRCLCINHPNHPYALNVTHYDAYMH